MWAGLKKPEMVHHDYILTQGRDGWVASQKPEKAHHDSNSNAGGR